jgi:hypothetical protein
MGRGHGQPPSLPLLPLPSLLLLLPRWQALPGRVCQLRQPGVRLQATDCSADSEPGCRREVSRWGRARALPRSRLGLDPPLAHSSESSESSVHIGAACAAVTACLSLNRKVLGRVMDSPADGSQPSISDSDAAHGRACRVTVTAPSAVAMLGPPPPAPCRPTPQPLLQPILRAGADSAMGAACTAGARRPDRGRSVSGSNPAAPHPRLAPASPFMAALLSEAADPQVGGWEGGGGRIIWSPGVPTSEPPCRDRMGLGQACRASSCPSAAPARGSGAHPPTAMADGGCQDRPSAPSTSSFFRGGRLESGREAEAHRGGRTGGKGRGMASGWREREGNSERATPSPREGGGGRGVGDQGVG